MIKRLELWNSFLARLSHVRITVLGVIYLLFYVTYSYSYYHVNSYKLVFALAGLSALLLALGALDLFYFYKDRELYATQHLFQGKLALWGILLLPLMGTLPGQLLHGSSVYTPIELTSFVAIFFWALLLFEMIRSERELTRFLYWCAGSVIAVSVVGFVQLMGFDLILWQAMERSFTQSSFGNTNYFAGFLATVLPLLLILGLPLSAPTPPETKRRKSEVRASKTPPIPTWPFALAFGIGLMAFFLARTRSSLVLALPVFCGFTILFYALEGKLKDYAKVLWASAIGLALLIFAIDAAYDFTYIQSFLNALAGGSWQSRMVGWSTAWNSILASPWFGYGLGSSYNLFFLFVDPTSRLRVSERSFNHVHNELLEYTQEGGLYGLLHLMGFFALLFFVLVRVYRSPKGTLWSRRLSLGLMAALIGYNLDSIFNVSPRMMVVRMALFTWVGITLYLAQAYDIFNFRNLHHAWQRRLSWPLAMLLLVTSIAYISPWMISVADFQRVTQNTNLTFSEKVEQIAKMQQRYPNIYPLGHLANMYFQSGRYSEAIAIYQQIETMIPNYRTVRMEMAMAYMNQREPEKAMEYAKLYQSKDWYLPHNVKLLTDFSLRMGRYQDFVEQVKHLGTYLAFDNNLIERRYFKNFVFELVPSVKGASNRGPLEIEQDPALTECEVRIDEKFIGQLYTQVVNVLQKSNGQNQGVIRQELTQILNQHLNRILATPAFERRYKGQPSAQEQLEIDRAISRYFQLTLSQSNGSMNASAQQLEVQQLEQMLATKMDWANFKNRFGYLSQFLKSVLLVQM